MSEPGGASVVARARLRVPSLRTLFALCAGAATVFGFAPFDAMLVPLVTVALLFLLWQDAPTPRAAAWTGYVFGLGMFGVGASWVATAMHTFGGMPFALAAIATAAFCAYLALFPALAGWIAARCGAPHSWQRVAAAAAAWTLVEWLRSFGFSGFGWLSIGYSQLPGGTIGPFAPFASLGGVFLVSLAVALAAALLALAMDAFAAARVRQGIASLALIVVVGIGGIAVGRIEWTTPLATPLTVSLLQGNVAQNLKFDPAFRQATFDIYAELAEKSRGRLIVLPESAFPMFADDVPDDVLLHLLKTAAARDGDALIGLFTLDEPLPGEVEPRYYNTVVTLGTAAPQIYRKRHLVPFGEVIPLNPWIGPILRAVLAIPLASQTPGVPDPPPLEVAGLKVAVNICYEDSFGADVRPQARRAALLINVTNDAWYGHSLAAAQHNQIAGMRAVESARPLLRATNTGITSAFDHHGRETQRLPWFTRGILEVTVTGREGLTPYVRFGDAVAVAFAILTLAIAIFFRRRRAL